MTRKGIGTTRALSLLLSLVLAVGLLQAGAVPAAAETVYSFTHAYDCQRSPAFPKKGQEFEASSFKPPLDALGNHIGGELHAAYEWKLTPLGKYSSISSPSPNLTSIAEKIADPNVYNVNKNDVEVFQLAKNGVYIATGVIFAQSADVTVFLGDNWNANGSTYLLSNKKLDDPTTVTISRDVTTGFEPPAPPQSHTHQWKSTPIDGLGTKAASTTISCVGADCDSPVQVDVSLAVSDVTLPGNVFSAKLTVETTENPGVALLSARAASQPLPGLPEGLTVSEPGYKYSATGSDYAPIDPNTFPPKAGYYQASVLVTDANQNTVADLAVKYTVSDPAVTAATGDNRPIELMIMGMAFFCAMAAAAFVLDGRRKAH